MLRSASAIRKRMACVFRTDKTFSFTFILQNNFSRLNCFEHIEFEFKAQNLSIKKTGGAVLFVFFLRVDITTVQLRPDH